MADDGKFFDLEIITPDRVFWTGKASMLELNTTEGEVGIYKRHIPMTMIIEPGIVKIHEERCGSGSSRACEPPRNPSGSDFHDSGGGRMADD